MKSWLEKRAIELYSTHNEKKSFVTERFIRTLKNKIYKYRSKHSALIQLRFVNVDSTSICQR